MKTLLCLTILTGLITSFSSHANDAIIIVANTQDKSINLTRQEVRNLFMGGALPYQLTAVALPQNNQTRVLFNTKVVGLTESRIQSYWAQMRFSGRKIRPKEIDDEMLVIEYLKSNLGAVAYLPANMDIPTELTVLFKID